MNYFDKPKLLTGIIIALLVLNFGILAFMWFHISRLHRSLIHENHDMPPPHEQMERFHSGPPAGDVKGFLINELKLNPKQQEEIEKLRVEHFNSVKQIKDDMRKNKDELYRLYSNSQMDTNRINQLAENISNEQKQIELNTFYHFRKVRDLCDDNQKKKFDEIIGEVLKMMAPLPPLPNSSMPPPR